MGSEQELEQTKPVIDVTEKYFGRTGGEGEQQMRPVINDNAAAQRLRKMEELAGRYNNVLTQMKKEDIAELNLMERIKYYVKKKQPVSAQELFGGRIDKMRGIAEILSETVAECSGHQQTIMKNLEQTSEQLAGLETEFKAINTDVGTMGKEYEALGAKGVVPKGFKPDNVRMYKLENSISAAVKDAQLVVHLKGKTEGYWNFYDFHMNLYNEMIALGKQATREVALHTGKMEELLVYVESPQKIVENFLKVYKILKTTSKYLDQIYGCLMGYTSLVQGIGLPGILSKDKYNQMTATTAQMKERNKQFTSDYRATMNNLEKEMQGEVAKVVEQVK
jgi:hypothetical protein